MKSTITRLTIIILIGVSTMCAKNNKSSQNILEKLIYNLSMSEPYTHYFNLEIEVSGYSDSVAILKMPVWTPGSYLVREFSQNIDKVIITAGKEVLPVKKIAKNSWEVQTNSHKDFKIQYKVYAYEQSVRTSFLSNSRGFVNGASVFLYIAGKEKTPGELHIKPYKSWKKISTGLPKVIGKRHSYKFNNYDILIDSPILIGNHDVLKFKISDTPHEIAIYGEGNIDKQKFTKDVGKIVKEAEKIFGALPYKRYVFIIFLLEKGRGGLEHLNSTAIETDRWIFSSEKKYKDFLSLVAHEYFHTWNVKRIRPIALGPFDYDEENYTEDLWIAEGITSYYEFELLLRSRLFSTDDFFEYISKEIKNVELTPGRYIQSLSDASFDTWIKYYRRNENSPNSQISYYTKGSLIGLILYLTILENTSGKKSLDDVFKTLYSQIYKEKGRGYTSREFRSICETIAGKSLNKIWQYIEGTDEIDYNYFLNPFGCELNRSYSSDRSEKTPYFGFKSEVANGKIIVKTVYSGSGAYAGGLNENDEIIAIDDVRVNQELMFQRLKETTIGEPVHFLISREGMILDIQISPGQWAYDKFDIQKIEDASSEQKHLYELWVNEPWEK